jgi:hypothetical protein
MRLTRKSSILLAPALLASVVFAQIRDERAGDNLSGSNEISAARSPYTTGIAPDEKPDPKDDKTLAQLPRTRPEMQFPPQRRYPRGNYQTPWTDHGSAGHVLIGAAIGFGVGAALGAKNSAQNGTPVSGGIIIGGGLFGLIGGALGAPYGGLHPFEHRSRYRPSWPRPDDDEESNFRSSSNRGRPQRSPSAKPVSSSPPRETNATALPASVTPPESDIAEGFGKPGTLTTANRISQ